MEDEVRMRIFQTQLPISKIKKICKLDPDSTMISSEAAQLITMATERFIGLLAKAAYGQAALMKRRTIQMKDVEECIRTRPLFEFLEGTLDGWPEMNTSRKNNRPQPSVEQNEKPHNCSNEIDIQQNVPSSLAIILQDSSAVDGEAKGVEGSDSAEVRISENTLAS
uniref:CBFD_NFYB_HMF domain-containing protein n=1 Tax=Ascaris lumbricoides TaxID=6252 RepID=A0A0M3HVK5_ASCLU